MTETVALLIRVGHSRHDIFEIKQAELPYEGWSLQQLRAFVKAAERTIEREKLFFTAAIHEGIVAALDKNAASKLNAKLKSHG